ncbi:MAG: thiamine pyrophosphokinase [Candidatus Delongbacteria bacterium]
MPESPTPLLILNGRAPTALLARLRPAAQPGWVDLPAPLPVEMGEEGAAWTRSGPLWAADGGANTLHAAALPAACVVGDLDSLTAEARLWHVRHGARLLECPEQDDNDLEKALRHLAAAGCPRCWVGGFEGDRLDMLLGLAALLDVPGAPALRLAGEQQILLPLGPGEHVFPVAAEEAFSLLAPAGCRLNLAGARWGGPGLELRPGCHGVSNRALGGQLRLTVLQGRVHLVRQAPWGSDA